MVEERLLADLRDYPLQPIYFPDNQPDLIDRLAADIAAKGLREFPDILPQNAAGLPANTILRGHRRRQALLQLGFTGLDVTVRYDLANSDAATIEAFFLTDNTNRQQLDRLSQARIAKRLFEIEQGCKPGQLRGRAEGEARERVGRAIGMSGRNLQRYLNVLRAPVVVQQAFQNGDISLVVAASVAGLPRDQQAKIGCRLAAGEAPQQVLRKGAVNKAPTGVQVQNALTVFLRGLKRSTELRTGLDWLSPQELAGCRELLERGAATIQDLLQHADDG